MIYYSPVEPIYYLLPLIGFVVGLFGTLLGGGGGFVFLPVLILLFDTPIHTAVITALVATLPIGLAGSAVHYRKGHVRLRLALIFSASGLAGAFSGTFLASFLGDRWLKIGFGIYCILMAVYIVWNTFYVPSPEEEDSKEKEVRRDRKEIKKGAFFGFPAGLITGAFGTSGSAPILAGLLSLRIPVKIAIGTSLVVVSANTLFAIGAHFLVGRIDMTLVLLLTSGAIIGAVIGPNILSRVNTSRSEGRIKYLYALAMALLGLIMILNLR